MDPFDYDHKRLARALRAFRASAPAEWGVDLWSNGVAYKLSLKLSPIDYAKNDEPARWLTFFDVRPPWPGDAWTLTGLLCQSLTQEGWLLTQEIGASGFSCVGKRGSVVARGAGVSALESALDCFAKARGQGSLEEDPFDEI